MLDKRANTLLAERYPAELDSEQAGYLGVKGSPVCACPAVAVTVISATLGDAAAFGGGAALVTGAYALGKAVG